MDWHDMQSYLQGKDPKGRDKFFVPLPPDEDGMVGRECPRDECQPRYFKIAALEETSPEARLEQRADDAEENHLNCPYCGHQAYFQEFTTRDQLDWVKSLIERDMVRTVQNTSKRILHSTKPSGGGPFAIRLSFRPSSLPSVRYYAEKKLKRIVECDECGSKYAVYGIATFCPRCGRGNLRVHLRRSAGTIKTLLDMKTEVEAQGGQEARYHLLGNCLEDCVSLFEGFKVDPFVKTRKGPELRCVLPFTEL